MVVICGKWWIVVAAVGVVLKDKGVRGAVERWSVVVVPTVAVDGRGGIGGHWITHSTHFCHHLHFSAIVRTG